MKEIKNGEIRRTYKKGRKRERRRGKEKHIKETKTIKKRKQKHKGDKTNRKTERR